MTSSLKQLTTDEAFLEPSTIGELLPNGRQRYLAWAQTRNKEIGKNQKHNSLSENYDSDCDDEDDNEIDHSGVNFQTHGLYQIETNTVTQFMKVNKDRMPANRIRKLLIYNLRTLEIFPSKYLVDSDDDDKTEKEETPSTLSATVNNSKIGRIKKKRKSALFQTTPSLDKNNNDQIFRSIPPKASGIVGVMGRSVDLDQFIDNNNDDDDAGLYSMLRAWVNDDPEKAVRSAAAAADSVVRRKTLLEYSNQDGVSPPTTSTKAIAKHPQQPKLEQPKTVDVLGWMGTDPLFRSSIPCYPTQKEMRELLHRRLSRREDKAKRKRRLDSARKSLRRKGINV
jgi:hypothetical protein